MVSQAMVEAHANSVKELSLRFQEAVAKEVDDVVAATVNYAASSLSTSDGVVNQTSANAKKVVSIEEVFTRALNLSEYYPTVLAFVSNFSDQHDEFSAMYEEMRKDLPLPAMELSEKDHEVLSNQAANAVMVMDGFSAKVAFELRQLLARSLGGSSMAELVKGLSDVIRTMTKVGPIAKDQLILFLRLISSLTYENLESLGHNLVYSYVGPKPTRDFCSELWGKEYTKEGIASLKNDQFPNVLVSGGGHGCTHWWAISGMVEG